MTITFISSVQSLSHIQLQPHGLQHARLPYPSLSPRACSNSCSLSQWCYLTISPFVAPFSSWPQSFPALGFFSSESALCIRWSKYWSFSIILPMNIQGWFPLGLTGLISPLFMEFSRQEYWSGNHSLLQGNFRPRDQTRISCIAGRFFTMWATWETLRFFLQVGTSINLK